MKVGVWFEYMNKNKVVISKLLFNTFADLTRFKSEDDPTPDYDTANSTHSQDPNYHRDDDQVNVRLDPGCNELPALPRKFLRLSALATVTHLRKYVSKKVFNDVNRFREVDIYFNKADNPVILGKDHSLKFVNVLHWRDVRRF